MCITYDSATFCCERLLNPRDSDNTWRSPSAKRHQKICYKKEMGSHRILLLLACLILIGCADASFADIILSKLGSCFHGSSPEYHPKLSAVGKILYLNSRWKLTLTWYCDPQLRSSFNINRNSLKQITEHMLTEMDAGLRSSGESSLLMIPTHLTASPTGQETGSYLALDLGGTNFRVLKVLIHEKDRCMFWNSKIGIWCSFFDVILLSILYPDKPAIN